MNQAETSEEGDSLNDEEAFTKNPSKMRLFYRQLLAVCGPFWICVSDGMVFGYSAILLPQLETNHSSIQQPDMNQQSWIASLPLLSTFFGCLIGGYAMDKFGRKPTQLFTACLTIAGWLCIYFAWNLRLLLIGRFVTGLCIGLPSPCNPAYIAEVSAPKYRLPLLASIPLGVATGMFAIHCCGTVWTWRICALTGACIPCLTLIALTFVYDSYITSLRGNRIGEARLRFFWFRGCDSKTKREFAQILLLNQRNNKHKIVAFTLRDCFTLQFFKALLTINIFFAIMQFSGNKLLIFYTVRILRDILPNVNEFEVMLGLDLLRCLMSICACYLSKAYRLRPLAMLSGYGTSLALLTLSIGIHLSYTYLSLVALIAFNVFISIGLLSLPWALCGEIFPANTKGLGSGVTTSINCISFFVVIKVTPSMIDVIGYDGVFLLFAGIVFVGITCLYFLLPETKNKTLEELQNSNNIEVKK